MPGIQREETLSIQALTMILWRGGAAQNGAGIGVERTSIAHPASPTPFYGSTYSYDAVGRLGSVTNDRSGDAFTYGYQDQSFGLVRSVTGPVHTVTNDWEAHRNILDKKTNGPVTAPISSYDYTVNGLGQRTNLATDGVQPALTWTYNARGELVETADASASDFDRAYQYDGIGNREKTAEGLLVDLPASANYQADALNQYSSVTLGSTALSPVHDLDGNATSYPLPADGSANSTLVWDGENRLVSATTPNNVVTTFTYDYLSRRMTKATTTGATTATECYLYDGWNPVVEKRAPTGSSFDEIRLYTWGIDLSGSSQGAGGVAGLLAIEKQGNIFSSSPTTDHYYPTYDGNGNVSEYLDSASLVVAHFEYDPFGNTTVNTDTAGLFDILFSTKKGDLGTGLYYYGYRYYDPVTGRWPSRDPIGERGGINLYGFSNNNGLKYIDILGLSVGQPGTGESMIPVWGSGRAAVDDFQNGKWGWGTVNVALAITDVFLVKSLVTGIAKGGFKACGSHTWSATRSWYGKRAGGLPFGAHVHHWGIHQNGPLVKGARKAGMPDDLINKIINQPWNLKPMIAPKGCKLSSQTLHNVAHGIGRAASKNPFVNKWQKFNVGTPGWAKMGFANISLRATRVFECDCECPTLSSTDPFILWENGESEPLPEQDKSGPFGDIPHPPVSPLIDIDSGNTSGWVVNPGAF